MTHEPRPRPRPVSQVLDQQKADADRDRQQRQAAARSGTVAAPPQRSALAAKPAADIVPSAKPPPPAEMPPDNRTPVQRYLDEIAPATLIGRRIKFSKNGEFVTADDDAVIDDSADFVALCDQVLIGRIKFKGEGNPPDYRMGLLYDGFVMPDRATLGDTDPTQWEIGLSGKPEDPWGHHNYLPLQRRDTSEFFTFTSSSDTGRRAVGSLLRHYDRMRKAHPDELPVVRLKAGGFNHRDPKVGWVPVPVFAVVGRTPRDSAVVPDTSPQADFGDSVPY
jgi:hypothetical protein